MKVGVVSFGPPCIDHTFQTCNVILPALPLSEDYMLIPVYEIQQLNLCQPSSVDNPVYYCSWTQVNVKKATVIIVRQMGVLQVKFYS